jgi:hypothetical protein
VAVAVGRPRVRPRQRRRNGAGVASGDHIPRRRARIRPGNGCGAPFGPRPGAFASWRARASTHGVKTSGGDRRRAGVEPRRRRRSGLDGVGARGPERTSQKHGRHRRRSLSSLGSSGERGSGCGHDHELIGGVVFGPVRRDSYGNAG